MLLLERNRQTAEISVKNKKNHTAPLLYFYIRIIFANTKI